MFVTGLACVETCFTKAMHNRLYRVILSRVSGAPIAVAENTSSQGKSTVGGNDPFPSMRFSTVSVFIVAMFGSVSVSAHMVAYKSAGPPPTIERTANNLPIVQIATPDQNSLSHNRYTDFNVDTKGAILNNAHTITNTNLAG